VAQLSLRSAVVDRIVDAQKDDPLTMVLVGRDGFLQDAGGVVRFGSRLCVPNDVQLRNELLSEAHRSRYTIHLGTTKMYRNLKLFFWWAGMKRDIAEFVSRCLICQQVKAEHQRPSGLLQRLDIPLWKWEEITMDFVVGLPRTQRGHDAIWVVVDRLTKSAHFIPIRLSQPVEQLAKLYVDCVVRLHGIPVSIISDRDARFTSKVWRCLQAALGTQIKLSTAFHPQTDGQSERTIQTLEDMLRSCSLDWKESWDKHLSLVEFAYNNSFHASIGMAPFEALYGRPCRSPVCWNEVGERRLLGPELVQDSAEKVQMIRKRLLAAQSRQKSYADQRRKELAFEVGDRVFLKVSPSKGVVRFGQRGKLNPRFIGPFEILERVGAVAYRLALPPSLDGVHNVFHVSMLKKYLADLSHVIEYPQIAIQPDMSFVERPVRILDRKTQVLRTKSIPLVKVLWQHHSFEEATWELEEEVRKKYPELFGMFSFPNFEDEISLRGRGCNDREFSRYYFGLWGPVGRSGVEFRPCSDDKWGPECDILGLTFRASVVLS